MYVNVIQRTEQRYYQTRSCHSLHCQTAVCDCAVSGSVPDGVMWHSPCTQRLTAAGSPLNILHSTPLLHNGSLQQAHLWIFSTLHHCSTMAHCSRLTFEYSQLSTTAPQWLTAAGSPLNILNSPPPLHTTYHGAVPLNSHHLITSSADAVTSDLQFADTTCGMTSQQCWQFRLQ